MIMGKRQGDPLGKALEFGASFDWITPLASLLSPDTRISTHWENQNEADDALDSAGISTKRRMLIDEYYSFDVDKRDAGKALSALSRAGVTAW
jgi:hypothetical protein